jgi:hypothetical protein
VSAALTSSEPVPSGHRNMLRLDFNRRSESVRCRPPQLSTFNEGNGPVARGRLRYSAALARAPPGG